MALAGRSLRLTFLGCGHIGGALLGAILPSIPKTKSPISDITIALNNKEAQARPQKSFRGRLEPSNILCENNIEAIKNSDAVLFAFPPEKLQEVLAGDEIRKSLKHKHIISILARTTRAEIAEKINGQDGTVSSISDDLRIVRAMPTMGTEVHESATLIGKSSNPLEQEALELAMWIFSSVGKVFHVDHDYFETATGMSAFTNALITTAVQAISQQAVAEGVPKEHAIAITSQCIRGMASLMLSGKSPEHLQWSLSAPGSITGQAISRLKDSQLSSILESSLSAAISRAKNTSSC
ncbi:unnamed protein product [Penicillium salamii]|uniref:Pyrroline-5-carboxylate reductase n=1 Tax=Penicillium salamii TaxID=1612424 RepID=A0A9W4NI14_9EURO|nr:unnamed protein product [Penicillium salamii]